MKISEVITRLKRIETQFGDLPVVGSADEEQNIIGDIFAIQYGEITEYDSYTGNKLSVGDKIVVLVPAI